MAQSSLENSRAREVADEINADAPEDVRAAIYREHCRVEDMVLAPRGLAERKILIVGGAGYIGSVLCQHLLARGYGVRCLDSAIYHNDLSILSLASSKNFEYMAGDLCDPTSSQRR